MGSVIEKVAGTAPASGASTLTLTLTSTLVASDVLVVLVWSGSTGGMSVAGTGGSSMTLCGDISTASGGRLRAYYKTGQTGAGLTVTVNTLSGPYAARVRAFVIRGLTSSTFDGFVQSPFGSHQTGVGADVLSGGRTIGKDQVAIGFVGLHASITTFPGTSSTPAASDWTAYDLDNAPVSIAQSATATFENNTVGARPTPQLGFRPSVTNYGGAAYFVFGAPETPPPVHTIVRTAQVVGSTTHNLVLPTLQASDQLVLVTGKLNGGSFAVSGGVTWVPFHNYQVEASDTRMYVYTATGITGTPTVTFTSDGVSSNNSYLLYIIRGAQPILTSAASSWYATDGVVDAADPIVPAGTAEGPAALAAGYGQVALFVGALAANSAHDQPPYAPTPATGWVVDNNPQVASPGFILGASRLVPGLNTVQGNLRSSASVRMGSLMLVTGMADTTTFIERVSTEVAVANSGVSIPITTDLLPSDLIVVTVCRGQSAGVPTVSGLGATYSQRWSLAYTTSGQTAYMFTGTGGSGPGNLSVTVGSVSQGAVVDVWIIRGLVSTNLFGSFEGTPVPTTGALQRSLAATPVPANSAIILLGNHGSPTSTLTPFPTSPTPGGDWSQKRAGNFTVGNVAQNFWTANRMIAPSGEPNVAASYPSQLVSSSGMLAAFVFGTPPAPWLAAGWGVPIR